MKVTVCDSTVLITLSRIQQLELLRIATDKLVIPQVVYDEVVTKGQGKPGSREVMEAEWIETRVVENRQRVLRLQQHLGKGESEAIALAIEINADLLILDDLQARKRAARAGLPVVGTLGLLKYLKESGHIFALKPIFEALKSAGFYMSDEYENVLSQMGE